MTGFVLLTQILAVVGLGSLLVGIPVITGMRSLGSRRESARSARMRSAVESVAEAAWSAPSADAILEHALAQCRAVTAGDVDGELERLAGGRFRARITTSRRLTADAHQFLRELERVVADAAERHTLSARLRAVSSTDALTGLPNGQALEHHLARALARAAAGTHPVALLACDVAGLARVNELHGRSAGDRLLLRLAEHVGETTRDIGFVARTGGDQFVVVVEAPPDETTLIELARRLRRGAGVRGEAGLSGRLAIGLTVWEPGDPTVVEDVLRDAHVALAVARSNASGLAVFDAELRSRTLAETERRDALAQAVDAGRIVTVLQPLVDARTLSVVGVEVLARWHSGDRLVGPAEWLDVAEDTGLIVPLGADVLRQARAASERWRVDVAVNVSARQLDLPDFAERLEEAWGDDRWDMLTIEVTESALLFDAAHVRDTLETLAARGVRISIDDFGTGYNSLARLGQLPLHELKIDKSFVDEVTTVEGAAVVRAIVGLAEAHGLDVVAEGVERPAQLAALVALGVPTVQGYMFGRPRRDISDVVDGRARPRRAAARIPQQRPAGPDAEPALRVVRPVASA
ncbi:putative bifunctional diguanylate cyclase/phosphodiesterase [Cellulomonas carbonis]|uniref:Diguanylate cyclase n=1 Tax=Cellulomonas carbonis T26 TaxID=947969 RepID=A0A0A0BNN1_9CELL|nr:bifunctional diguanylate cyclase/phosphodiesterase [Cellulomonas carbonis]KGM10108.1 diguanylate cyclase [Cellulomonas carbonis T26]GGB94200.1 hypothetical protein GCM10010972_03590 [Cellulomonas carbonis]